MLESELLPHEWDPVLISCGSVAMAKPRPRSVVSPGNAMRYLGIGCGARSQTLTGRGNRLRLMLAFAPINTRSLGLGCGMLAGISLASAMIFLLLTYRGGPLGPNLSILSNFFFGFSVSWRGALVGLLWSGIAGYVTGWLFAFICNLVLVSYLLLIKTKPELQQYKAFVEHL